MALMILEVVIEEISVQAMGTLLCSVALELSHFEIEALGGKTALSY
jgi:hypothetical protein